MFFQGCLSCLDFPPFIVDSVMVQIISPLDELWSKTRHACAQVPNGNLSRFSLLTLIICGMWRMLCAVFLYNETVNPWPLAFTIKTFFLPSVFGSLI